MRKDKVKTSTDVVEISCPQCGTQPVLTLGACHTWPGDSREDGSIMWMGCQGCNSATYYYCQEEECDWHYTHGLNTLNPRSEKNELSRPEWLPEDWDAEYVFPGTVPWWE
jgi:hypothetical protein